MRSAHAGRPDDVDQARGTGSRRLSLEDFCFGELVRHVVVSLAAR
jgi:hypothetical protein